jgi:SAM-dependent methyltransferase
VRKRLASYLTGQGLDLGPGHQPFECPPKATARFVDRWEPDENAGLFPELAGVDFPRPDVIADFDTDRLSAIESQSQDFVVCSHVLEHLADPLGMITDIHRVLRLGGLALIVLPDRRRTFDRTRPPTSVAHLAAEHQAGITVVDEDHIREFAVHVAPELDCDPVDAYLEIPERLEELPAFFDRLRARSIHVHCWADREFQHVLLYGVEHLGWRWHLIDWFPTAPEGDEFGFLLQRSGGHSKRRIGRRLAGAFSGEGAPASRSSRTWDGPSGGTSLRAPAGEPASSP